MYITYQPRLTSARSLVWHVGIIDYLYQLMLCFVTIETKTKHTHKCMVSMW